MHVLQENNKKISPEKVNSMSIEAIFLGSCLGGIDLNKVKKPD